MIPAAFDYAAPTTLEEALSLLAQAGDEGKILAGGQSLIPVMKLRLAAPEHLIDLGKIDGLNGVSEDGDAVVIRGWCEKAGAARIGFGECLGTVLPART